MRNSIVGGIFIGIAGFVYLSVGGIIGALGFSLGFILVCIFGASEYTGKAGFVGKSEVGKLFYTILLGNIIGCIITAAVCSLPEISDGVGEMLRTTLETRARTTILEALGKAILCGIIVDCVIYSYKKTNSIVPILLGVPAFILCGFYHCIADCFYYALGFFYDIKVYNAMASSFIGAPDYIPGLHYLGDYMLGGGGKWYNIPLLIWISSIAGNFIGCNIRRFVHKETA